MYSWTEHYLPVHCMKKAGGMEYVWKLLHDAAPHDAFPCAVASGVEVPHG